MISFLYFHARLLTFLTVILLSTYIGLMKASSSVIVQCCHPLSSYSVICLAPSPLQEHFPSACKMITGWLLDFSFPPFLMSCPLYFSVSTLCSPPSHHPKIFLFSGLKWMWFPGEWSTETPGRGRHLGQLWCLNTQGLLIRRGISGGQLGNIREVTLGFFFI